MAFLSTQGQVQVTRKGIVQYGRNSKSSEILCLSWLPVSLKMIQPNVKALSSGQYFLHLYKSMGNVMSLKGE